MHTKLGGKKVILTLVDIDKIVALLYYIETP